MTVMTYSPKDVTLTFGGYVLANWDEITVAQSGPAFRMIRGIRGKSTRVRTLNKSATITLVLPHTSVANQVLDEICRQDQVSGNGRLELTLKDVSGSEVFSSADAFIEKQADRNYSATMGSRTWVIQCMSIVSMSQSDSSDITSIFR